MAGRAVREVVPESFADLRSALAGCGERVSFGIGFDGAVYAAARMPSDEELYERGMFPKSRLEEPTDLVILRALGDDVRRLVLYNETVSVAYVQPIGEHLLLVGARCVWRRKGAEENALMVDWDGRVVRRFTMGDGIADVRTTPDGMIWASYFDEGVFGNYGWASPGPEPIGQAGLVVFDAMGERRFAYDAAVAGTDTICDAYAMNVTDDGDVWVYFYTEFPLVRIRDGSYRAWPLGARGARAFAVRGQQVLLFGDYERRDLLRVVALERTGARVVEEAKVVGTVDQALPRGHGASIFFFREGRVFRIGC